jgi:hypothetical protein
MNPAELTLEVVELLKTTATKKATLRKGTKWIPPFKLFREYGSG